MKFIFDTHGGDSELNSRSGQIVTVLRELTEQEADIADVGEMFRIRFEDGFETDAFADELTALGGNGWYATTRWSPEDVRAAAEEQGVTLTEEQAVEWWRRNESRFQNLLVEYGNAILAEMDFNE